MRKLKGQFGSFASFILVVMIIFGLAHILSFASSTKASVDMNMDDLGTMSEASMYGDFLQNDFLRQALKLSEQQAVYNLRDSGSVEWTNPEDTGKIQKANNAIDIRAVFADFLTRAKEPGPGCEFEVRNPSSTNYYIRGNSVGFESDGMYVKCESETVKAVYNISGDIEVGSSTRYVKVVGESKKYAEELQDDLSSDSKTGEGEDIISCQEDVSLNEENSAKGDARSEAKSDARSKYDVDLESPKDVLDSGDGIDMISSSWALKGDMNLDTSSGTCTYQEEVECSDDESGGDGEGSDDGGDSSGGDESDGGDETCTETRDGENFSAEAEFDTSEIQVDYDLKDNQEEILTGEGRWNPVLGFRYFHNLS